MRRGAQTIQGANSLLRWARSLGRAGLGVLGLLVFCGVFPVSVVSLFVFFLERKVAVGGV